MPWNFAEERSEPCKQAPNGLRKLQRGDWVLLLGLVTAILAVGLPLLAMGPTRHHVGEVDKGIASWYGAEQGGHTASGEHFDQHALTAAHRRFPFDTIVRVTNQLNGKSVEVRINDRGPWRHDRIIDVTSAAASILDMKRAGAVPVTVEIIQLGPPGRHHHG